jgi:hypothetical protein
MNFRGKQIAVVIGGAICFVLLCVVLFKFPYSEKLGMDYLIIRDVLLLVVTTLVTILVSLFFANWDKSSNITKIEAENIRKIDGIAERSADKMDLISIQIERAKQFLRDTIAISDSARAAHDADAALYAYRHRLAGAMQSLDQIGSSNDAVRSDWFGVVSPEMRGSLETRFKQAERLPEILDEARRNPEMSQSEPISEVFGAGKIVEEAKRRATRPPAVRVSQSIAELPNCEHQAGEIVIEVIRETFTATGTGKFNPVMSNRPYVKHELKEFPTGINPSEFSIIIGVGTTFDFNVKLKSTEYGKFLAMGKYVVSYETE